MSELQIVEDSLQQEVENVACIVLPITIKQPDCKNSKSDISDNLAGIIAKEKRRIAHS